MKTLQILSLLMCVLILMSCQNKSSVFLTVGNTAYSYEDMTRYALYFGFDTDIAEVKFIEHALLNEASRTVPDDQKEADKLYFKFVTPMLYNLMKRESAPYETLISDDYFSKSFVLDYDFFLIHGDYTKRTHATTIHPGELPAPIDYLLSTAKPGDVFSDIETKHGFFTITVREIRTGKAPEAHIIKTIRSANAMAYMLLKLKKKYDYRFYPENVEKKGSEDTIAEFKKTKFSVLSIEKATLLPVKFEERYHAIRYYAEIKLLEMHFSSDIKILREYCSDLARIRTYQNVYFSANKNTVSELLGSSIDVLTLSSDDTASEQLILYPELQHLSHVKKGDTVVYNKTNMKVIEKKTHTVTSEIIEEYLLRQMFQELQKKIPVKKISR